MNNSEIKQLLDTKLDASRIEVEGGDGKYLVRIVSDGFDGLNAVKRQQTVYRILNPHISSGAIHAVSMELLTSGEYAARQ